MELECSSETCLILIIDDVNFWIIVSDDYWNKKCQYNKVIRKIRYIIIDKGRAYKGNKGSLEYWF